MLGPCGPGHAEIKSASRVRSGASTSGMRSHARCKPIFLPSFNKLVTQKRQLITENTINPKSGRLRYGALSCSVVQRSLFLSVPHMLSSYADALDPFIHHSTYRSLHESCS